MRFPSTLKVLSVSYSIKQYQLFVKINSPWNIERILSKSELGRSDKIRSHKKAFADNLTNDT